MASASLSSQAATALSLASSLGLSLRADWIEAAARAAATAAGGGNLSSSSPLTAEALVSLVLNADLNSAGAGGSLPGDLDSLHGRTLSGRRILQADEVVNAAASAKHRYSGAPVSGRMLKLLLTDGSRHVVAFELEPVPALSADLHAGCKLAVTDPLVLRGMLALRPANVAVLGGRAPRLGAARERARAEWAKAPDGRGGGGAAGGGTSGGRGGAGGPTLYEKARAAAWPGAAAEAEAGAAAPAAAAAAAAAAPPARAPLVAAPPPQQQQQQQQEQNQAPSAAAAAPPPAVILLDSSDDEDVKMEARDEGDEQQQQQPFSPLPAAAGPEPASLPLPAAAGPAPASLPRRPLSEAAAAAATTPAEGSGRRCLVRGRVVQATSALRFMDAGTGSALEEFGLDVELEESSAAAASGGSGSGSGGSGEEEGFTALARVPATLSHPLISGLLGCISPRDLVDQYAREGGREALVRRLGAVKAFFDAFDGWLAVEGAAPAAAKRESGGGSTAPAATASLSLVVVGWWEA